MRIEKLSPIIKKIEIKKKAIAKHRDELRELYEDIGDLLASFDTGIDSLDEGILNINNAIDAISEVV